MENKEWNPKDWQGRSKKQVESSYRAMEWAFNILAVALVGFVTYAVIMNLT